jgi:hypothetical protein
MHQCDADRYPWRCSPNCIQCLGQWSRFQGVSALVVLHMQVHRSRSGRYRRCNFTREVGRRHRQGRVFPWHVGAIHTSFQQHTATIPPTPGRHAGFLISRTHTAMTQIQNSA